MQPTEAAEGEGRHMFDRVILQPPGARRALATLIAFSFARAFLTVGQAFSLASAFSGLWAGALLADQAPAIVGFLACFIGRQGVAWGQDAYLDRFSAARADELRDRLLHAVFVRGHELAAQRGTGDLCSLALEGIDQIETYLRLMMPKLTGVIVVPVVLLAWILPLDWVSGVIALVVFPFIILYMVMLGHTAKSEAARRYREFGALSSHFVDSLRGLDTLKFFGRSKARGRDVFAMSERFREITMKTLRIAMLSGAVLDIFATLSLAAVAIMLGFRLVDGSVALFPAMFVLILTPEYFRPVREFAADYHASLDGKNALADVLELVEKEGSIAADRGMGAAAFRKEASTSVPSTAEPAIAPWTAESSITLEDVDYAYPGSDRPALAGVSLEAHGCMKVGIVGLSGSGKSTLLRLLAGFAGPTRGAVSIDGRDVDLRDSGWLSQATYIPQDPYIFHASLRENMAFYRPDATEEEVWEAVDALGLRAFVDALPDGLETLVGEGGRAVSGGQAQRIALARALLDPSRRILLFDEPTAHLDIETEMELKERMLPLMEGRLVFFATHRLHWMGDMDMVLVVEAGRIVERGRASELLARGGAFARLAEQVREGVR